MSRLTRYVPIAPAPPRRPSTLPAPVNLDSSSPSAISRFENNTTSETRHHVEPDLSVLYQSASTDYQVPLFDHNHVDRSRPAPHHALAHQQHRLRTTPNYGTINIPTTLPPAPRTTSRHTPHHTPQSPDKHTFAVPRLPQNRPAPVPAPATDAFNNGLAPDLLQNYLNMISTPTPQADAIAPATPAMNQDYDEQILKLIQSVAAPGNPGNPTPHSTPFLGDYTNVRSFDELLTSPEFTSPLFEDTPNLSDASPFTPSSSSTRHQTSPALFDYSDTSSGGIPLFGPSPIVVNSSNNAQYGTPNLDALQLQSGGLGFENLDSLLSMPNGSPTSPAMDTQALFSPNSSPLFTSEHDAERPGAGQRSVSDPNPKRVQPTGHRKNLVPEQLLPVDAPTQQRNYYGPSATSRKVIPAGFEERRAKIVAKRRRGLGADGEELPEEAILQAAVEDKRRANTVAARRSRQRKLEHVKKLEDELEETKRAMELWKERAIAAEGMVRRLEGRE